MRRIVIATLSAVCLLATPAAAKVVKFEVVRVDSPAFEGRTFGTVGTYDRIIARVTIAVDADNAHNAVIADIFRAPRNEDGLVEAVTDVEILRPTNAAKANRRLLYDVVNRGNKVMLGYFNDAPRTNNPVRAADAGSGFLMNQGYTLVWSGWQGDLSASNGLLAIAVPTVPRVTGLSREEFIFDNTQNPVMASLTYPAADPEAPEAQVTVREYEGDNRATPTDLAIKFTAADQIAVTRPAGFDAGAIYELIYRAKEPKVMGLGFAATRDVVAFLRHHKDKSDAVGTGNPLAGQIDTAIGFGQSQSGRFLHDLLYLGFNEDENGRVVFDGLIPLISGGKRMFTNYTFAQPGRNMQQHGDKLYPGGQFPFTYPVMHDPVSGRSDGLLALCLTSKNCPKIFHVDTELEFYQSYASLVTTDPSGAPVAMPNNVRLYLLSSLQHAAPANAKSQPTLGCALPSNPLYAGPILRALLVAMEHWVVSNTAPPQSRYPSRADGTLVTAQEVAEGFPRIGNFVHRGVVNQPVEIDHSTMPPTKQDRYPVFVPKTDADGNDIAGIRLPTLAAPAATHLGWNPRAAGFAEGALCGNTGSMLPFAATREERIKNNDPRLSLEERYPKPGDRPAAVERAARQLVQDRLLLEEDVKGFLQTTN
ncbi:MAG: alpha/beta hydrolase domain-containing protein [Xanthobacteraceae bacterium]